MTESSPTPKPSLQRSSTMDGKDDSNLCRICRGEATDQEPLFHPCKCSGSIMYVHQECLMEWLSHSQKKHCELCKTSFQFTKLYSPEMPERLPLGIFLRRAAVHTVQNVMLWMRGGFVACTWAIWLPWTMRFVWWGLFWLADVGWVKDPHTYSRNVTETATAASPADTSIVQANATATDANLALLGEVLKGPVILRMTSYMLRSLVTTPGRGVLNDLTPDNHMQTYVFGSNNSTSLAERGTILSGVHFLNSLTPSVVANRVIIDLLEGQIITLALVGLIILVLLIREWVVQQQPIVNAVIDNEDVRQALQRHAREGERPQRHRPRPGRRRTSTILRDTDNLVKVILEEQAQQDAVRPDLAKAEMNHIRRLHTTVASKRKVFLTIDTTRALAEPLDNDKQHSVLNEVNETFHALRWTYADAVGNEDLDKLKSLRTALRLYRKTLDILPYELTASTRKDTEEMKASLKSMMKVFKLKHSIDNGFGTPRPPPANRSLLDAPQTTASELTPVPQEPEDRDQTSTSRPIMPPRNESSVATNIQRNLEEGVPDSAIIANSAPDNVKIDISRDSRDPTTQEEDELSDADGYENIEQMTDDIIKESVDAAIGPAEQSAQDSARIPMSDIGEGQGLQNGLPGVPDASPSTPKPNHADSMAPVLKSEHRPETSNPTSATSHAASQSNEEVVTPRIHEQDAANHAEEKSLTERATGWFWGDLDDSQQGEDDREEQIVNANGPGAQARNEAAQQHDRDDEGAADIAAETRDHEQNDPVPVEQAQAQAQAQAAGLFGDVEGIDDAEDLEGFLELIGMQGPLTNLFTNAMFASVFVSCTVVISVWVPFILGKIALIAMAHPISVIETPMAGVSYLSNVVYDVTVLITASTLKWMLLYPLMMVFNGTYNWMPASMTSPGFWHNADMSITDLISKATARLVETFRTTIQGTDVAYSALTYDSHAAVRSFQNFAILSGRQIGTLLGNVASLSSTSFDDVTSALQSFRACSTALLSDLPLQFSSMNLTISYKIPNFVQDSTALAPRWTALDRGLAITLGYTFVAILAAIYYMRLAPLARGRQNRKIETTIIEILQQAGGITKVVLIISIEMLVFPLYCGLLLDVAMLPLFQDTGVNDRFEWSKKSPWISLFVHWFLGTAYMFHFALFVAMCRKMFRKGVLYFIRDPDDPTFHPVRDVLDRTVASQLKKILSSAVLYGGLVIVCIGTLVWSLGYGLRGILPIQWRPTGAANAFPFDLVIYMLVRPLAIKHFTLSEWLQDFYKSFFRKSAQSLRLTHFLFGEEKEDERGPVERRGFTLQPKNGKWLRVPANDGVRFPRGVSAFVEVDEDGKRLDGSPEPPYPAGKSFKEEDHRKIFVPHHFGLKLLAFVASVWTVTALVGIVFTILPLLLGRLVLHLVFPGAPINDIYAFSIGIFLVCSGISTFINAKVRADASIKDANDETGPASRKDHSLRNRLQQVLSSSMSACRVHALKIIRCCYVFGILCGLSALALSAMLHLYILNPAVALLHDREHPHVIKISESLVLGTQLVRTLGSILMRYEWRISRALHSTLEDGVWNPKPAVATRYVFLPVALLSSSVLLLPTILGRLVISLMQLPTESDMARDVQIFIYPALLSVVVFALFTGLLIRATGRWRMRIRDEVFLIGERLHNYGEKKPPPDAPHSTARLV
ncbi:MAG: hypothetical protein Q9162_003048 [Coniocarpon cinnabarinum]